VSLGMQIPQTSTSDITGTTCNQNLHQIFSV
jgi:hypothetical protein